MAQSGAEQSRAEQAVNLAVGSGPVVPAVSDEDRSKRQLYGGQQESSTAQQYPASCYRVMWCDVQRAQRRMQDYSLLYVAHSTVSSMVYRMV